MKKGNIERKVYFSPEEWAAVQRKAAACGMRPGTYIRIMSVQGDSGLYLRGSPQVQIWDAHNQWHIGSGGLYNNKKNPSKALSIQDRIVGSWNTFHITMRGERVTVELNGVKVVDNTVLENYWDRSMPIFPVEQIELQCHGDPIEFKNIFIREL